MTMTSFFNVMRKWSRDELTATIIVSSVRKTHTGLRFFKSWFSAYSVSLSSTQLWFQLDDVSHILVLISENMSMKYLPYNWSPDLMPLDYFGDI